MPRKTRHPSRSAAKSRDLRPATRKPDPLIPAQGRDDAEKEWLAEVKRRVAELDSGKVEPVPADEVMRGARVLLR